MLLRQPANRNQASIAELRAVTEAQAQLVLGAAEAADKKLLSALLRPPAKAAKPPSPSCEQPLKHRLSWCRVLLRPPAKAAQCAAEAPGCSSHASIAELRAATEAQAQMVQDAAEAAG